MNSANAVTWAANQLGLDLPTASRNIEESRISSKYGRLVVRDREPQSWRTTRVAPMGRRCHQIILLHRARLTRKTSLPYEVVMDRGSASSVAAQSVTVTTGRSSEFVLLVLVLLLIVLVLITTGCGPP